MKAVRLPRKSGDPNELLCRLLKRVPPYIWITFAASMVLGLAAHLYTFTNKLPNLDDTLYLFDSRYGRGSGRWFLPTVMRWDGDYSMPWLIGALSLLCIAAAACLTVSLLHIRRPVSCVVAAGILAAFPSTAETFAYMFSADSYFFSLALAAFGAYAALRFRRGWNAIVAIAAITLSMGIYQSYFAVAAVLMVGSLVFELLEQPRDLGQFIKRGFLLVGILFAAMALYLLIVRITRPTEGLTPYMGISNMGQISLREIPVQIVKCYGKYYKMFWENDILCHFGFLRYAFVLTAICAVTLLVLLVRQKQIPVIQVALTVVLIVLYPLAGSVIYLMAPHSPVFMRMVYGLCYILLAPVAMVDFASRELDLRAAMPKKAMLQTAASWVILVSMALTAYSYIVYSNKAYFKIDIGRQQCVSYSTRLLERIEACEGYSDELPVILIGSTVWEFVNPTPQLNEVLLDGVYDLPLFRSSYSYGHFLRNYLGFPNLIFTGDSSEAKTLAQTDGVRSMPVYPAAGSICQTGGAIVVKLSDGTPAGR